MKACPDCDWNNADNAVTCAECGSLFIDQVGVVNRMPKQEDPVVDAGRTEDLMPEPMDPLAPVAALLESDERTETRGSTVVACRACGAVNSPTSKRCAYCGSNQLAEKSAETAKPARKERKHRLSAWERRPRKGVVDGEFPDVSAAFVFTFIGIGLIKLLLCTSLGLQVVTGQPGLNGLHPVTYAWKWAVGPTLLLDAFLAGVGAIGLFYLRKYGAALMSASLALDVLLLSWLVVFNTWGTLNLWPGSGPYFFLACVCVVCSILPMNKAIAGDLL